MKTKVRQVTDSVHGTIYISELEHQMMSTPFFYRLNDVYQSSTVYMTFPSNRTKRFEHSLGTMELAGQMFYSAVSNATPTTKCTLLTQLQKEFEVVLKVLENRGKLEEVRLYQREADTLDRLLPQNSCNKSGVIKLLQGNMKRGGLVGETLCKQDVCFLDLYSSGSIKDSSEVLLYIFLYRCTLEALRISALFHDIGHPPFSHIIEFTLERLYNEKLPHGVQHKQKHFRECLEKFVNCNAVENMLLDFGDGSRCKNEDKHLHEQIGLHILYNSYRGVLSRLVDIWGKKTSDPENRLQALYLVVVIEFTFGILLEKAPVFASLHRIVDGTVDVDRLDYCVRDTHNSGVNWGVAPYSRLLSSSKFIYVGETLRIAFPEKVCDDIDDLLVNRYKIFQRINYHHKSVKTSELMQRSVEMLAEDYLISDEGNEIMPEIKKLWECLEATFGLSEAENKISQWTDSWLVSVLSEALTTLNDPDKRLALVDTSIGRSEEKLDRLCRMLEEVQLNKKTYYPLLKRHRDALMLRDKIKEKAGITENALDALSTYEYEKLINETGDKADSAREALYRIVLLQSKVLDVADFSLLDTLLPIDGSYKGLIEDVLKREQEKGTIQDYFLWNNMGFNKLGVSDNSQITLFREADDVYAYDISTSLMKKLEAEKSGCLWMFAYVCFTEYVDKQVSDNIDRLFDAIASAIGEKVREQLNLLFDFKRVANAAN